MTDALELDALWEDFHRAVNMTSQEPAARLRVGDADEDAERLPQEAGTPTGQHVLAILQKRRADLTDEDIRVMYRVVDTVGDLADEENGPAAGDTHRRHRPTALGHDPLKP